jgi:hypothetical protein
LGLGSSIAASVAAGTMLVLPAAGGVCGAAGGGGGVAADPAEAAGSAAGAFSICPSVFLQPDMRIDVVNSTGTEIRKIIISVSRKQYVDTSQARIDLVRHLLEPIQNMCCWAA